MEQIAYPVEVKCQRKAERLVQRIGGNRRNEVGSIDAKDVHLKAGSQGKELQIPLIRADIRVSGAEEEAVVVTVLHPCAPIDFLHLLLKSAGRIAKRLEDAGN